MIINNSNFILQKNSQVANANPFSYILLYKSGNQIAGSGINTKLSWESVRESSGDSLTWSIQNSCSVYIQEPGNYYVAATAAWFTSSIHSGFGRRQMWIDRNDETIIIGSTGRFRSIFTIWLSGIST